MTVRYYLHPRNADTLWNALAVKAICAECARKRYDCTRIEAPSLSEIDFESVFAGEEKRLLIVIGASNTLTPDAFRALAVQNVHVLLLHYESSVHTGKYSKILLDYKDGMRKILGYLAACGRTRIALYGINPDSPTDMLKDDFFTDYLRTRGQNPTRDIYYNYGSQDGCFARFAGSVRDYDAVICANDVLAISLCRRLKSEGVRVPEDLYVTSFGSTLLAERSSPSITSVAVDHEEVGRQAVLAYAYLYKNPCDITLTVKVDAKLTVRASTAFRENTASPELPVPAVVPEVDFYGDPATKQIFDAERLLLECDELDFGILTGILSGETYPHIAEKLYTSENVISYRIKRMCRVIGCSKKSELVSLLKPYLQ